MQKINQNEFLWIEKYRPQTVTDLILPQDTKDKITSWIANDGQIPNMILFSTNPGLGKTSISKAISNDLNADVMFINASKDNGIDVIRNRISNFASSVSFEGNPKIVTLDECLEENEEVLLGHLGEQYPMKLKELEFDKVYDIVSYNMETNTYENDTCVVYSKKQDELYEVELENGSSVKVTSSHPFIVNLENKSIQKSIFGGLIVGDEIVVYMSNNSKIKSIKKIGSGNTVNLTVHRNHTFITKNGIVTHNCDGLSSSAQESFRGFIEEFTQNTRFILTANYSNKIIEPILNRLIVFDFDLLFSKHKQELAKQCYERLQFILENEGVEYAKEDLKPVITQLYPSVRKMINVLQDSVINGKLQVDKTLLDIGDKYDDIIDKIKSKQYDKCRTLVSEIHNPHAFYNYVFKNMNSLFVPESIPSVVVITYQFLNSNTNIRDPEITLAAYCALLMRNAEVKFL